MNKPFACILVVLVLALAMWIMAICMNAKSERKWREWEREAERMENIIQPKEEVAITFYPDKITNLTPPENLYFKLNQIMENGKKVTEIKMEVR